MSTKDLLSPYINRFVAINQQMSNIRLEFFCKDGKVTVNCYHDLGVIPGQKNKTKNNYIQLPVDSDFIKKNINSLLYF